MGVDNHRAMRDENVNSRQVVKYSRDKLTSHAYVPTYQLSNQSRGLIERTVNMY